VRERGGEPGGPVEPLSVRAERPLRPIDGTGEHQDEHERGDEAEQDARPCELRTERRREVEKLPHASGGVDEEPDARTEGLAQPGERPQPPVLRGSAEARGIEEVASTGATEPTYALRAVSRSASAKVAAGTVRAVGSHPGYFG